MVPNSAHLHRPRTYGKAWGTCNICGTVGKLTFDHVPPKACLPPTAIQLVHVAMMLGTTAAKSSGARYMQSGIKYRTLCGPCNNGLGHSCDPELVRFCGQVSQFIGTSTLLPPYTTVLARPQRFARSVLGHLCALGVDRYRKGPHTEAVRDYLTDYALPMPGPLRFYYWLYPYRTLVAVRDAVTSRLGIGQLPVSFWLLKFFPLAIMVTWDEPAGWNFNVSSLDPWRDVSIDDEVALPVQLTPVVEHLWPEAPEDLRVIMYGEAAVTAGVVGSRDRS